MEKSVIRIGSLFQPKFDFSNHRGRKAVIQVIRIGRGCIYYNVWREGPSSLKAVNWSLNCFQDWVRTGILVTLDGIEKAIWFKHNRWRLDHATD